MLLFWDKVKTIVPQSQSEYANAYIEGKIRNEYNTALEKYSTIINLAGEKILDFEVINEAEKRAASEKMFDLVCYWNKDTAFYNSLKINSIEDMFGKEFEYYWFLNEKTDSSLIKLLLDEKLVVNWAPGEIAGFQDVGKSYMSIIAEEMKNNRRFRLTTDDEFYIASKAGVNQIKNQGVIENNRYQTVSLVIPQIYLDPEVINKLSYHQILKIRKDILPLTSKYYRELEDYQKTMNSLIEDGFEDEALDLYCEFCERVSISFLPFSKEVSSILRYAQNPIILGVINGIVLPSVKILNPDQSEITKYCDYAALASTVGSYSLSNKRKVGFEYLECLNRNIKIESFKGTITCLIPKSIKRVLKNVG